MEMVGEGRGQGAGQWALVSAPLGLLGPSPEAICHCSPLPCVIWPLPVSQDALCLFSSVSTPRSPQCLGPSLSPSGSLLKPLKASLGEAFLRQVPSMAS